MAEARPLEPAPVRGPIFIIGSMGSGTTLLRLMLDSHRTVAVPHETGFMRIYNSMRFVPFKWTGRGWAKRLGWSDEELDEVLRSGRPWLIAGTGFGGLAALLYLMVFKPF